MNRPNPLPEIAREGALLAAIIGARLDFAEGRETDAAAAEAKMIALGDRARIDRLCALFGATPPERAALMVVAAPLFDPSLSARYQALTGRAWVTEPLVERLYPDQAPVLVEAGLLARWGVFSILQELIGEPPAIAAAPELRSWLSGRTGIPASVAEAMSMAPAPEPLANWPVAEVAARLAAAFKRNERVRLVVSGLEGAGRASFVAAVAAALGQSALIVDPARLSTKWSRADTLTAQRAAIALGAALIWRSPIEAEMLAPGGLWPAAFQAVAAAPGDAAPAPRDLACFDIKLPPLDAKERARLIDAATPAAAGWSAETRTALATRPALTPGAIARLARTAPKTDAEALAAANRGAADGMGELAEQVPGDLGWDDLILPEALKSDLCDLAYEARVKGSAFERPDVERLFRR
ncbi:MAG: hypothetical protein AAF360_17700, partial [Pseudomonadota bacterium]